MSIQILDALSRLASRRFGSFADAATAVLGLLESAAPGSSVALGQIDWDEGECRFIDARGTGLPRGSVIRLARGVPATGSEAGDLLDGESLAALCPANWVAAPLDAADGRVVGMLLATGADGEAPPRQIAQLLLVGARLLSYEWESISSRAELRRLAEVARDRATTDPVTGLPNRETLLDAIEREWELSKRGTVESYVVVCHMRDREALTERHGEAMSNLLLKDVAEVLSGAIRRTDYLARVSPDALSAVLVGCKGPDGALAFLGRAERSLERVTDGRPANLQLSYGIQRLADANSTNEALELAEISARTTPARRNGTPLGAGPSVGSGPAGGPA
jgi:diguanylate cyclase (GGDEF)-like protein